MVDLAKIRKKAKKGTEGNAGVPPAEQAASSPPPEPVLMPPPTRGEDTSASLSTGAARSAGEDAGVPPGKAVVVADEDAGVPNVTKLDKFKAAAGKRREAEAARVEVAGETLLELLTFVIAGEHYAVDIERIVEIVTPRNVTRIPNADATVVGIMSLRGTIVTLVDVRKKLRHRQSDESTADTRIVVIDFNNEIVGFLVDRVLRVVKASAGEIEPHPVVHATELDEAVRGVFQVSGALTILLDLDKLLNHTWT